MLKGRGGGLIAITSTGVDVALPLWPESLTISTGKS